MRSGLCKRVFSFQDDDDVDDDDVHDGNGDHDDDDDHVDAIVVHGMTLSRI